MMDVQIDIESEYDLIQLLSEGWISKLYLAGNFSFKKSFYFIIAELLSSV